MKLRIATGLLAMTNFSFLLDCDPCTTPVDLASSPNYEQALEDARESEATAAICELFPDAIETGTCGDGSVLFISSGTGFVVTHEYYDAETGEFIGSMLQSDAIDQLCGGVTYSGVGRFIDCSDRVVVENLCP
ncbi:MAG: hypothetical protein MI923_01910 [Phycisphaerales bacterium]|nr:hypothetical protein [Phycisphaerales bacterium]